MIDLRKPYAWDAINEHYKSLIPTNGQIRFYQSTSQAILEVVMAFQNLYSHKRQSYFSLGLGTHAEEALLFLSRQGIKNSDFFSESTLDDKKTLFCLLDQDDAITAEIYRGRYKMDEKVFRINIFHHLHFYEKKDLSVGETEVAIYSFGEKGALAFLGKRCATLPSIVASTLTWAESAPQIYPWTPRHENKSWVQSVEAADWTEGKALLKTNERIFDRVLVSWSDLDGEALRQTLIREHGIDPMHLESLSLSRWDELKLIPQFEKRGWTAEEFRGTLLMSSELSKDTQLQKKMETAVQNLRQRSRI